jgi:LemA protein
MEAAAHPRVVAASQNSNARVNPFAKGETIKMNKNTSILVIVGVLVILIIWGFATYNGLISADEQVKTGWGNLQSAYQRRADLYASQLPVVVAGSAQELAVFKELVKQAEALSGAFPHDAQGNPVAPTAQQAQDLNQQVANFDTAAANFKVYVASNPQIVSGQLYSDFLVSIEGTENRINVNRRDYNAAVQGYRVKVRSFPGNMFAGMLGLGVDQYAYFEAQPGTSNAPTLTFPTPAP